MVLKPNMEDYTNIVLPPVFAHREAAYTAKGRSMDKPWGICVRHLLKEGIPGTGVVMYIYIYILSFPLIGGLDWWCGCQEGFLMYLLQEAGVQIPNHNANHQLELIYIHVTCMSLQAFTHHPKGDKSQMAKRVISSSPQETIMEPALPWT